MKQRYGIVESRAYAWNNDMQLKPDVSIDNEEERKQITISDIFADLSVFTMMKLFRDSLFS